MFECPGGIKLTYVGWPRAPSLTTTSRGCNDHLPVPSRHEILGRTARHSPPRPRGGSDCWEFPFFALAPFDFFALAPLGLPPCMVPLDLKSHRKPTRHQSHLPKRKRGFRIRTEGGLVMKIRSKVGVKRWSPSCLTAGGRGLDFACVYSAPPFWPPARSPAVPSHSLPMRFSSIT